jgi:hypothetical protein
MRVSVELEQSPTEDEEIRTAGQLPGARLGGQWLAGSCGKTRAEYRVSVGHITLCTFKKPHLVALRGSHAYNHNHSHVQAMYQPCLLP